MKNQFRIVGDKEGVNRFFEVCRAFQNSTPLYECIVMSSWPLGGEPTLGMCIQLSDKTKNAEASAHAIANACGVKLESLTDKEYELASKVRSLEIHLMNCRAWIKEVLEMHSKGHIICTGMDWERVRRLLVDL